MLAEMSYDRFEPPGVSYKGKLIGVETVHEPRGDRMCQEAMNKLKTMVKVSGEHKQRVILNISSAGVRILDERTMREDYLHEVQKISFVSRDPADVRAFGLVAGDEGNHKFFAIKTEKAAFNVVLALKELFESVLKTKQRQIEDFQGGNHIYSQPGQMAGQNVEQPPTAAGDGEEEDPSSLYAVPHKSRQQDIAEREESLAELARTVEVMQEGLHNMEEFSIAPPPPASARRASREPLSPTPEVTLESPFVISAPAPKRAPPQPPSDPFQSQLMENQITNTQPPPSASEDLFKEFGDTLTSPLTVQYPQSQAPNPNPFGPPMGSSMTFNAGYSTPMAQQGFGMPAQTFPTHNAMHDPFSSPSMGAPNSNDLFSSSVLQPTNSAPPPPSQSAPPGKPDPFSDFAPLGGGTGGVGKSGKDQFSGFKMAKPGEVGIPSLTSQQQQSDSTSLSNSSSSDTSGLGPDEITTESGEAASDSSSTPTNHFSDPSRSDRSELLSTEKIESDTKNENSEAEEKINMKIKPEIEIEIDRIERIEAEKNIDIKESKNNENIECSKYGESNVIGDDASIGFQNGSARSESSDREMHKPGTENKVNSNGIGDTVKTSVNDDSNNHESAKDKIIEAKSSHENGSRENGSRENGSRENGSRENGSRENGEGDVTRGTEEKELDVRLAESKGSLSINEENVKDREQSTHGNNNTDNDSKPKIQNGKLNVDKPTTPSEETSELAGDKQGSIDSTSPPVSVSQPSLLLMNTLNLSLQKSTLESTNSALRDTKVSATSDQIPPPSSSSSTSSSTLPLPLPVETDTSSSPEGSFPSPNEPPPKLPEDFDFPSPQVPPPPLPQGFSFPIPDFPPPSLKLGDDLPSPQVPPPPLPKGYETPTVPARDTSPAPPPIPPRPGRSANRDIPSLPIGLTANSLPKETDTSLIKQAAQTNWTNFDDGSEVLPPNAAKPFHSTTTVSFDTAFSSSPSEISPSLSASISIGSQSSVNAIGSISRDLFQQVPFDHVALSSSAPAASSTKPSWAAFEDAFSGGTPLVGGIKNDPFHPSFSLSNPEEHSNQPSSLPVHEDPFADDPFAIESEDNDSFLTNTDMFGGTPGNKQLTTSTGIPLILDDDPFGL